MDSQEDRDQCTSGDEGDPPTPQPKPSRLTLPPRSSELPLVLLEPDLYKRLPFCLLCTKNFPDFTRVYIFTPIVNELQSFDVPFLVTEICGTTRFGCLFGCPIEGRYELGRVPEHLILFQLMDAKFFHHYSIQHDPALLSYHLTIFEVTITAKLCRLQMDLLVKMQPGQRRVAAMEHKIFFVPSTGTCIMLLLEDKWGVYLQPREEMDSMLISDRALLFRRAPEEEAGGREKKRGRIEREFDELPPEYGKISLIDAGASHLVVVLPNHVYVMGTNTRDELAQVGDDFVTESQWLLPVKGVDAQSVIGLACGRWHTLLLHKDNAVSLWGHRAEEHLLDEEDGTEMICDAAPVFKFRKREGRIEGVAAEGNTTFYKTIDSDNQWLDLVSSGLEDGSDTWIELIENYPQFIPP